MAISRNLVAFATSFILISFLVLCQFSCGHLDTAKKKIVYVNSYHSEFPPSRQITEGVYEKLPVDSFEIVTYFMDTKRNPSEDYIIEKTVMIIDSIKKEDPDLLIVSDDNAVKYLVVEHFQDDPMPIVFCGVNWSAAQYDLTGCNITGIIEILPIVESVRTLKSYYPSMQNLLVLNENTTTSRKTRPLLDTLLSDMEIRVTQELVEDFENWKTIFIDGNKTFDAIYLQTRGAIKNWDHDEALNIIDQYIKVPLFTCEDFMMPYAVLGLTQVSKEQGIKAAEMAKRILNGANPADIPVSSNTMAKVWINTSLAKKIHFVPEEDLQSKAAIVK